MNPTGRFWRTSALAVFLAAFALLVDQPVVLLGSVAIVALLLVRQWAFFAGVTALDESLSVDVDCPRRTVRRDESVPVTLRVSLARPVPVDTTVTLPAPLLATGDDQLRVHLPAGTQRGEATAQLRFPTAGTATFDQPTVTMTASDGLFTETIRRGPDHSVVVEPRVPRNIHVGEGGDKLDAAFGMHRTGELGQGTDPAELREYTPGDDVGAIDWKATARQGEAYVREYEVESDRRTVLLFDHRGSTATGPPGEQLCTYLREVALAVVSTVERFDDPIGLYTVGDDGLTTERSPATGTEQYRAIRTALRDVEPTGQESARDSPALAAHPQPAGPQTGVTAAASKAAALSTDDSTFARTLEPFFADTQQYLRRVEEQPLFEVARTYAGTRDGGAQTLLFTSDSDPAQVREAAKIARGESGHVVVFLAPQVLFEEGGLTDLAAAYDRYTEFETFRRELSGMGRVAAYEVAPNDRLDALLAAGRDRVR